MTRWIATSLIATMVFSSVAQAQVQTTTAPAPDAATTVEDVTVIGGRIAPTTEDPKSASCEFLAATDPFLRAQIEVARRGGDPFSGPGATRDSPNALQAPRILQPTRFPSNVDYSAAPLSAQGSALPAVGRQFRGVAARSATDAESSGSRRLYSTAAPQEVRNRLSLDTTQETALPNFPTNSVLSEFSSDDAIDACRFLRTMGGATVSYEGDQVTGDGRIAKPRTGVWSTDWGAGKYEVAYRDKSLPTAFVLFQEHRYAESLDYFHRAFDKLAYDQGGDEAALMVGKLMMGAPGVKQDVPGAVVWLIKAGNAKFDRTTDMPTFDPREPTRNTAIGEAAIVLGNLYHTGAPGLAKDPVEARKWFLRARNVGHVRACLALGDIYYYGKDAPRDLKQAFKFYKEGATFGDAPAQQALAEMYYSGEAPSGRDLKLAAAWHNEAAKLGHGPSLYALANAYENGEGVAANPTRALGLYKLAALEGEAAARNVLGTYFYEGRIVPKDPALARRWFEQAAAAGDPEAMYNLGAMMMKGEGGDIDRPRAWVWLKIAQKTDQQRVAGAVQALERAMTPEEKAVAARLLAPTNS